ncbi:MAG: YvcK family protein [Desulfobacteraceae bacterium]|nr:YvcK family protein [Desulfobacteraceae bacterium]
MESGRIGACLDKLGGIGFHPLDLLPRGNLAEKLIALALGGVPAGPAPATAALAELAGLLAGAEAGHLRVVVFGGGTGLSNIIGGDSRNPDWPRLPFQGLKELFPETRSIVCVTDDGGSTGELLKDLPLIALGDIRHVLLSSIRRDRLHELYGLAGEGALQATAVLHRLFNYRFEGSPGFAEELIQGGGFGLDPLPVHLRQLLMGLLETLFTDSRLLPLLGRPHCLGNLLLVAAIHRHARGERVTPTAITRGIRSLAGLLGASPDAVWPCTTTPAALKIMYTNGVLASGEYKSAHSRRGYPVDRVFVEFAGEPAVPPQVLASIREADIIIFAPGSLFTSMVPALHVPGLAGEIRSNRRALKILVANLWAQKGETDLAYDDPGRRFYVSDLIRAYHRNIPGGVRDLFHQVLALGFEDIPGSILQSYALEDKVPIYLDRSRLSEMGFAAVEARLFSGAALRERQVIQHDPAALAAAVRTLWAVREQLPATSVAGLPPCYRLGRPVIDPSRQTPHGRLKRLDKRLQELAIDGAMRESLLAILWRHRDILVEHLNGIDGLRLVPRESWRRCQEWDKIYSYYEPGDRLIHIREDMRERSEFFEIAFLVALGQSLLGNYAAQKEMAAVASRGEYVGKVFRLTLRPAAERRCFFTPEELEAYLSLARMVRAAKNELLYTRLLNGSEQFTPPGMLFGLTYAWYLDNRHAAHIEYKMAITKTELSDLIPGQIKMLRRRRALIDYFRRIVFRQQAEAYDEEPEGEGC